MALLIKENKIKENKRKAPNSYAAITKQGRSVSKQSASEIGEIGIRGGFRIRSEKDAGSSPVFRIFVKASDFF